MTIEEKAQAYDAFLIELETMRLLAVNKENSTVRAVTLANKAFWELCRIHLNK